MEGNHNITQGTDSVTTYCSRMKDLLEEIDALIPASGCDCAETRPFIEHLRNQRLLQFLMYSMRALAMLELRSDILLKTPVLKVNQANALVIQEESQRMLGVIGEHKESLTMIAGRGNQNSNNQHFNNFNKHGQNYRQRKPGVIPGTICEHCGYKGCLKDDAIDWWDIHKTSK